MEIGGAIFEVTEIKINLIYLSMIIISQCQRYQILIGWNVFENAKTYLFIMIFFNKKPGPGNH